MNSKNSNTNIIWIAGKTLVLTFLILMTIFYFSLDKTMHRNGLFSEDNVDISNLEVLVSNQSHEKTRVKLYCSIDGVELFDRKFELKNEHSIWFYYLNVDQGDHLLLVTSDDGIRKEYKFNISSTKKYFYIFYEGINETADIYIHESDEFIGLK